MIVALLAALLADAHQARGRTHELANRLGVGAIKGPSDLRSRLVYTIGRMKHSRAIEDLLVLVKDNFTIQIYTWAPVDPSDPRILREIASGIGYDPEVDRIVWVGQHPRMDGINTCRCTECGTAFDVWDSRTYEVRIDHKPFSVERYHCKGCSVVALFSPWISYLKWTVSKSDAAQERGQRPAISLAAERIVDISPEFDGRWPLPRSGIRSRLEPLVPWLGRLLDNDSNLASRISKGNPRGGRSAEDRPEDGQPAVEGPWYPVVDCRSQLGLLADWLEATGPNLMGMTWDEALAAEHEWHQDFRKSMGYREPVPRALTLVQWPDGAHIDRLVTNSDFKHEGASMGHCIGGQLNAAGIPSGNSHYYTESLGGDGIVLSYRDHADVPQATVDIGIHGDSDTVAYPSRSLSVDQVQGPDDSIITDTLAQERLTWFLDGMMPHEDLHFDEANDTQLGIVGMGFDEETRGQLELASDRMLEIEKKIGDLLEQKAKCGYIGEARRAWGIVFRRLPPLEHKRAWRPLDIYTLTDSILDEDISDDGEPVEVELRWRIGDDDQINDQINDWRVHGVLPRLLARKHSMSQPPAQWQVQQRPRFFTEWDDVTPEMPSLAEALTMSGEFDTPKEVREQLDAHAEQADPFPQYESAPMIGELYWRLVRFPTPDLLSSMGLRIHKGKLVSLQH